MRLLETLHKVGRQAILDALGFDVAANIRPTQDATHGDYQLNAILGLAKQHKANPREWAEKVCAVLIKNDMFSGAEVAGPGFVNLRISPQYLASLVQASLHDERAGVPTVSKPETIVVDYSSPNIAKQMHVGHLRSTIIGQAVAALLDFVGHRVVKDNHVGDWGTQYGLLIAGLKRSHQGASAETLSIEALEDIYREASKLAKEDEAFADAAREELAKLQRGDAENLKLWQLFVNVTRVELDKIYQRLGVNFDVWLGESFYDPMLAGVIEQLLAKGLAREDAGALCVFFSELEGVPAKLQKQKEPFIVRKKDGAFLYSTTDLATLLHRRDHFKADRALYVVDSRQGQHFEQVFALAPKLDVHIKLVHIGFGQVLGDDNRPLKTRDGSVLTLKSLLDEAEARAANAMKEEGIELAEDELPKVARAVGIGAVKYADLRQNRLSDYAFDWNKMIEFRGNSGPYLQYAVARIRAIWRKGEINPTTLASSRLVFEAASEHALVKQLCKWPDVVHEAAETYQPHLVTEHIFELARAFSAFYEQCPVLKAEGDVRTNRIALTYAVERQISRALTLLGIELVDRM